jgi:hypothetical protein
MKFKKNNKVLLIIAILFVFLVVTYLVKNYFFRKEGLTPGPNPGPNPGPKYGISPDPLLSITPTLTPNPALTFSPSPTLFSNTFPAVSKNAANMLNSINYTLTDETPLSMTLAPVRVWKDNHNGDVWWWLETENKGGQIQLTEIGAHRGETLTIDITNKQYVWRVPGILPQTYPITSTK